jgi:hypothetical protein
MTVSSRVEMRPPLKTLNPECLLADMLFVPAEYEEQNG